MLQEKDEWLYKRSFGKVLDDKDDPVRDYKIKTSKGMNIPCKQSKDCSPQLTLKHWFCDCTWLSN